MELDMKNMKTLKVLPETNIAAGLGSYPFKFLTLVNPLGGPPSVDNLYDLLLESSAHIRP